MFWAGLIMFMVGYAAGAFTLAVCITNSSVPKKLPWHQR